MEYKNSLTRISTRGFSRTDEVIHAHEPTPLTTITIFDNLIYKHPQLYMKKTHIIFLFICFPFVNYCQELGPVNVSENLSLLLPKAYEVIYDTRDDYDSVGARKYVATMEKVTVVVTTIPDFRGEIDDEDQMNVFFKKFQVLMLLLAKGKLISERMVYIGSLKCKKFEMTTYNTNLLHWTSYIFRLESTTYTLQFIYPDPYEKNSIETEIVKSLSVHLIR